MPHTINGIGTWYWGKTNVNICHGQCEHCQYVGELRSYDTTNFFVVLYIPLIPLGRKRVIEECPSCRMHRAVGLKQWEASKTEAVTAALEGCQKEPENPEVAESAIKTAILFQDETAFNKVANGLSAQMKRNAGVLTLLGDGLEYFSNTEKAEKVYRASLALESNADISESLAINLLRQSRPDEAHSFVQHILDDKRSEKTDILLLLAAGYQNQGLHEKAISLLGDCAKAFPELENNADYVRLCRLSEKHKSTGKRVTLPGMTFKDTSPAKQKTWRAAAPRLVTPILLLVALTAYLFVGYSKGQSRDIYVVNGLSTPYEFDINGIRGTVAPKGRVSIEVPEGEISVKVITSGLSIPDQSCQIKTDFFTRPFRDYVFIINPDRAAILYWEETEYAAFHNSDETSPYKLYLGNLLNVFSGLDYEFQEFPSQLTVSSKKATVKKERVDMWPAADLSTAINLIVSEFGLEEAKTYVHRLASYDTNNEGHIGALMSLFDMQEVLSLLRSKLSARPVMVQVHRFYQEVMERTEPQYDLEGEYRGYLANDQSNTDFLYLLGRILTDRNESEIFFQRAIESDKPNANALGALAFYRLADGRFEEALDYARKSLKLRPGLQSTKMSEIEALSGLERFNELLAIHRRADEDFRDWETEIYLLLRVGRAEEADKMIDRFSRLAEESGDKNDYDVMRDYLTAVKKYLEGDVQGYGTLRSTSQHPLRKFQALVSLGKLKDAEKALEEAEYEDMDSYLLLHLAAHSQRQNRASKDYLSKAVEFLGTQSKVNRRIAKWLAGEQKPDLDALLQLKLYPAQKKVVLTAVGLLFPSHRDACFELARKLNYDRRFPHLLLKEIMSASG